MIEIHDKTTDSFENEKKVSYQFKSVGELFFNNNTNDSFFLVDKL